jgi:opacity protein-like surface antigen
MHGYPFMAFKCERLLKNLKILRREFLINYEESSMKIFIASMIGVMGCQGAVEAHSALCGLRLGAQVGYVATDSKVHISSVAGTSVSGSSNVSGNGVIGGVTLGWGRFLCNSKTFLGAEIAANFSNSSGKITTQAALLSMNETTKVKFDQAYDLSFRWGYLVADAALPYLKVGPAWGRWKGHTTSDFPATGSGHSTKFGVVAGIGVDFPVRERVTLGFEYNYRRYADSKHHLKNSVGIPLRVVKVTPTANSIMLRANFKLFWG